MSQWANREHSEFSPSPRPSPAGRGGSTASFGVTLRVRYFDRGLTCSLSQRERAGVRENGHLRGGIMPPVNA